MASEWFDKYVAELAAKQKEASSAAFKRFTKSLESVGFYELSIQGANEFLASKDGVVLLEEASANRVNFAELAKALGKSQKELHALARSNDAIYDAIDRGQARQVDDVEAALYNLAKGFTIDETYEETITDDRGRERKVNGAKKRYIMPSVIAQKYILENKRQMEYYDRQVQAEREKNVVHLQIEYLSTDDEPQKAADDE